MRFYTFSSFPGTSENGLNYFNVLNGLNSEGRIE